MTDRPASAWQDVQWEAEPERPAPEIRVFRHDMMPYAQDNQAVPDYVALVFNDEAGELRLVLNKFSLRQLHTTLGRVMTALDERDAPRSDADLAAAFAPIPTYPEASPASTPAGAAAWSAPATWPAAGPIAPAEPMSRRGRLGPWTSWNGARLVKPADLRSWMRVVGYTGDPVPIQELTTMLSENGLVAYQEAPGYDMRWFAQRVTITGCGPEAVDLLLPASPTGQSFRVLTGPGAPQVLGFYVAPEDAALVDHGAEWVSLDDLTTGLAVDGILWAHGERGHARLFVGHGRPCPDHPDITELDVPHEVRQFLYRRPGNRGGVRLAVFGSASYTNVWFTGTEPAMRQARALHLVSGARAAC